MMDRKRGLIIAIDGPVGAGKSTAARRLAQTLGYLYIDSGAMYRAIAWKAVRAGVNLEERERLETLAASTDIRVASGPGGPRLLVDGVDVTDELRTPAMDEASSIVSTYPEIRRRLVAMQRKVAEAGGVVMDGRDIGTVVFPHADVKFYLDADLSVRAARRLQDLQRGGVSVDPGRVRSEVSRRDERDCGREASPLMPAADAIRIDSTGLDPEAVLGLMLAAVRGLSKPDKS